MGVHRGELFFGPDLPMREVPLDDPQALVTAFEGRIDGFFVVPIQALEALPEEHIGALFAAALLVAALVESVARVDGSFGDGGDLISGWLEAHVPPLSAPVTVGSCETTAAAIFEQRFRHGLSHQGFIASRGRVSREIEGLVEIEGEVVTVNPFRLLESVRQAVADWTTELRTGARDLTAFQYRLNQQFGREVAIAREEIR